MKGIEHFKNIYFYAPATDMRKSINGLSILVVEEMGQDVLSPSLFLFMGKSRKILKVLYWDQTGFAIWQKNLLRDRFPKLPQDAVEISVTKDVLGHFLDGIDVWRQKFHKPLNPEKLLY